MRIKSEALLEALLEKTARCAHARCAQAPPCGGKDPPDSHKSLRCKTPVARLGRLVTIEYTTLGNLQSNVTQIL